MQAPRPHLEPVQELSEEEVSVDHVGRPPGFCKSGDVHVFAVIRSDADHVPEIAVCAGCSVRWLLTEDERESYRRIRELEEG